MPDINKTSVREELDRLKTDYQKQSDAGLIPNESQLLIQGLFTLLELMLAIFLEKKTTKTSKNSSKPSSQTDKDETTPESGSKSKGKKENKAAAYNTSTTETISVSTIAFCATCGEDLSKQPCKRHERRTRIDIRFEKVIEHVDAEIKTCDSCHAETKADFPSDMQGNMQYGNGIKAYVINLSLIHI